MTLHKLSRLELVIDILLEIMERNWNTIRTPITIEEPGTMLIQAGHGVANTVPAMPLTTESQEPGPP